MQKTKLLLVLLFTSAFFLSCNPDEDDRTVSLPQSDFSGSFGATAQRDFIGQVVDTDDRPIQNATVKIGTSSAMTDANGVFIINSARVQERFAYITAVKAGYNDGSRALVPTTGKNNVKIMLTEAVPTQTIQSGVASEVSIYSGTKIKFDGAFQKEDGTAYSGSVDVILFHLTPSDTHLNELMPGMLMARDAAGQQRILETYGMLQVELRGSGGQKLQIANGHTAQITMRIDPSQLAVAPATIPLWHFDAVNGYWKEEGSAVKQGNTYVGDVSHFSWWNCDAAFPTVVLTVNITDSNANALSFLDVRLTRSSGQTTIGMPDNNGQISGLIPANETLTLNVYSYCGNASIYTASIGPFSTNTTLPAIVLNNILLSTQVTGNLLKCDNSNVTNGYVSLNRPGFSKVFTPVSNASFGFNTIYCDSATDFTLEGFDYDSLQKTDSIHYNFTSPITHIGSLNACNVLDEFVSYRIDGGTLNQFLSISATTQGNYLMINASNAIDQFYIFGELRTPAVGSYTTADSFSMASGTRFSINSEIINTIVFKVNSYGNVGDYIDITFNGTYTDNTGTHAISGVVHVKRGN